MDQVNRICGLCGQSYVGYCNHGTAWEGAEYKPKPIVYESGSSDWKSRRNQYLKIVTFTAADLESEDRGRKADPPLIQPQDIYGNKIVTTDMYLSSTPPPSTRFICRRCQIVFEQSNSIGLNYCVQCNSTRINVAPEGTPLGTFDTQKPITDSEIVERRNYGIGVSDLNAMLSAANAVLPRCAVCGECPTAEDLADKLPGWLCCDPVPIMTPRRVISEAA